jgi:hypothetical protein
VSADIETPTSRIAYRNQWRASGIHPVGTVLGAKALI